MTPRQRQVVLAALAGVALVLLHSAMIDLPRGDVIAALDSDRYRIHWIQGTYLIGAASGMALTRLLADRWGLRRVYLGGLLLFTAMAGLCGLANNVIEMAPPRLAQGLGMGLVLVAAMVLVWHALPDQREWAMVGYGLAVYLPALGGAVLGGLLTAWHSWRLIFWINLPLGLAVAALAWRRLPPDRPDAPAPWHLDWLGFGLLVAWIGTLNVVLDMGQYWGWLRSPYFVPWLAGFVVSFAAFVAWGIWAARPLISLRPFELRNFALGLGIKALFSINLYVLLALLSAYMIGLRRYQWYQGGLVFLPGVAMMAAAAGLGYRWATPANRKYRMAAGLAIMAVMTWLLARVDLYTSKVLLAAEFAGWAGGAGLVLGPAMLTVFEGLADDQAALGAGIFNILRSLPAYVAGTVLVTLVVQTTDFYRDILGRNLTANRPAVEEALRNPARHFRQRGSPEAMSPEQAHAFLGQWAQANARAYAFQQVLQYLALAPLAGLLLLMGVRPVMQPTSPA